MEISLARMFHGLTLRDRETGNPLAGLSGAQRARKQMGVLPGDDYGMQISDFGFKNRNSGDVVDEWYLFSP